MAKPFEYRNFAENDAWLVFRVDTQVKKEPVDIYMLMDLPNGILLSQEIATGEGLSLTQTEELLINGKTKKGSYPRRFFLAKGDPAEPALRSTADAFGLVLNLVPASQLEKLIVPVKGEFGKRFYSPLSLPYAGLREDASEDDRESSKIMVPDSDDPCFCASGKKFNLCCKPVFGEIIGAMKAAEEGKMDKALEWIAAAKKIAGETAEILCLEAIVYSHFDKTKSGEVLARTLQVNPNHPRANYIRGILLKEKGDLKGAIAAYEAAIAHYPSTDRFHLNETYNNLGTALFDLGDTSGAKRVWEQALVLFPSDQTARQRLFEFIYENPIVPAALREISPFMRKIVERK